MIIETLKRYRGPAFVLVLGLAVVHAARAGSTFELGAAAWSAGVSGYAYDTQFRYRGASIDLRDDLELGRRTDPYSWLVWRSGNAWVPDLGFAYTHIVSSGNTILRADITWGGVTYVANGGIYSQVALETGHVLAFWNPIDNRLLNLRAGVEARWLNLNIPLSGKAELVSPRQQFYQAHTSAGDVAWVPMGDLGLVVHATRGLDVLLHGSYVKYARNYFFDFRAAVEYKFASGVLVVAGWRRLRLHFDDSRFTVNGDLVFKGAYAGVGYRF